jgi:hypothetical protein
MKIIKKKEKICCGCGRRPVFSVHSLFCRECSRLAFRMKARRFPPEAEKGVWAYVRARGTRCYYTNMPLEMEDIHSPRFCVFDHLIPLDPRKIVLTSALINGMKTALSEREFWFYVKELADYIVRGKKIKKIKLAYWRRRFVGEERRVSTGKRYSAKPKWQGKHKKCCLCGKEVFTLQSKYCLDCSHFAHRLEIQRFGPKVVQEILEYVRTHGFVCYYTGLPLNMEDHRSPWHGTFDCLVPGDRSKVVLACALVTEMKSDLSLKEFWYYIKQLANYIRHRTPVRMKKPVYWYRLSPQQLRLKSLRD